MRSGEYRKTPCREAERQCVLSILNRPEHFLRYRIFSLDLFQFLHTLQLIRSILQAKMRVGIQRYTDIRMPHKVLERLWIHAGLLHITTVGMTADVRSDIRHLHPVDIIIPLQSYVNCQGLFGASAMLYVVPEDDPKQC